MSGRAPLPGGYDRERPRERSTSPRRDARDRDAPYSRDNPNNDLSYRARRDYDRERDRDRDGRDRRAFDREQPPHARVRDYDRRDDRGGQDERGARHRPPAPRARSPGLDYRDPRDGDRDRERDRDRDRPAPRTSERDRDRDVPPPRGGPPARVPEWRESRTGPPGYGRRYDDGYERERPLDRRAIEEGRRRREEERARGVVFTEDGVKVPEPEPSAETTPAPQDEEQDEEAAAMANMLGFGGFGTTKNKTVEGNVEGGANVHKQRTWRQYMNRRGGFNRPLDKMKD
ncbi:hypothetical protein Q5752_000880 [Cryptotrichosporon argae]